MSDNQSLPHQEDKRSTRGSKKASSQEELKTQFGATAKVFKQKGNNKRAALVIGIIGMVMIILLILSHHHRQEKKTHALRQKKILAASKAIKSRIEALAHPATNDLPVTSALVGRSEQTRPNATVSKAMLARMNAPTLIYEEFHSGQMANASPGANPSGYEQGTTFIGQGQNQAFGNAPYEVTTITAQQVPHPDYTIVSGEMLHATLNVAMNSDLPGIVTATITNPAYSYTGANELIPKGSRLIGQYSSAVLQGQSRIFIMWNRLVLPDGVSVTINSPDTDQIGQAGEPADYVNRHFWSRFGESILMSILSAGVSNVDVDSGDEFNSADAYRSAVAESLQASAAGTLTQTATQKPTLVRYQGAKINVFIAHYLSFYNVYKAQGKVL